MVIIDKESILKFGWNKMLILRGRHRRKPRVFCPFVKIEWTQSPWLATMRGRIPTECTKVELSRLLNIRQILSKYNMSTKHYKVIIMD